MTVQARRREKARPPGRRGGRARARRRAIPDPPPSSLLFQIRKLPLLHQPWLHAAWGAAGAAGATALVDWTNAAQAEVDAGVAARSAQARRAGR